MSYNHSGSHNFDARLKWCLKSRQNEPLTVSLCVLPVKTVICERPPTIFFSNDILSIEWDVDLDAIKN
jgi:hypothetical protein